MLLSLKESPWLMIGCCYLVVDPSPFAPFDCCYRLQQFMAEEYQVLQHYPLLPIEGKVRDGVRWDGVSLFLPQRYNSVPWDVKRSVRFGGDLTLSHDGYRQWL